MEEQKLLKRKRKAKNEHNEKLLVIVCMDLAELYKKEGRYSLAIEEYEVVAAIYKKEDKLMEYARMNRYIGEAYMELKHYEKALEHQRLYLRVAKEQNDKIDQQRALATIGHIYLTSYLDTQADPETNLNSAYKFFMKSLMIAENLTGINKLEKVDMLARLFSNLGLVKESLGDYDKAVELFNRSIAICKQHDIYEQLYRGYLSIAALYEKRGEYNETIQHYNLAIDSAKKLKGNTNLLCNGLLVKAQLLVMLADFHGAKQALLKAYKLKTPNIADSITIERNLRIVAAMCNIEDKLIMAKDYKERRELYEKMGDGACELKNYGKAIEYYKLMLECAEKSGVSGKDLSTYYYSLAQTYKDNEQFSDAIIYFEKEYSLYTDLKDRLNTLSNIVDAKESGEAPISEIRAVYERAFVECRRYNNVKEEKRMITRYIGYLRRYSYNKEAFELNQYLNGLDEVNFEDDSSSDNDTEKMEEKDYIGDGINLEEITDDSSDSDVENQQSMAGTVVGKRRKKRFVVKKNAKGESQLHVACINGNSTLVHHLVEQGHPINVRDNSGWLPLHEACNFGHLKIVRLLLDKGAAINDRGGTHCNGITPLYDAANNGHLQVVQLLLDRGASAIAKADSGETPLDILQVWQKNNPLQGDDLVLYKSLIKRMSEAMEKAGQSSKAIHSVQASFYSQESGVKNTEVVSQHKRDSRIMDVEENSDYDEGGSSSSQMSSFDDLIEYKNVMGTLRKKSTNSEISPTPRTSQVFKRSALIVAEDDNLDDWLEDDLQASKMIKRRKTNTVASLMTPAGRSMTPRSETNQKKSPSSLKSILSSEYEVPDGLFEDDFNEDIVTINNTQSPIKDITHVSNEHRSNTNTLSPKRKNQTSLFNAGFSRRRSNSGSASFSRTSSFERKNRTQQPKITSFGLRNVAEADSTTPVSSQLQATPTIDLTQNLPVASGDFMVFVDVKVEGRIFRVPVLLSQVQTNTIGWLAEQAANKYARKEGSKPTLELETNTGALLSDEDPLGLLFPLGATQAEPVVGKVVKLSFPPLVDRYKEASLLMETDVDLSLCNVLEEVSITLNLSNKGVLGKTLAPLCKALTHEPTLLELDLSGNFLDTDCVTKLCVALPTLLNLNTLNLSCTGLTSAHLAVFVKVFTSSTEPVLQKLCSLNLSDNFLKNRSLPHLSKITAHLKLTALNLCNVRFTENLFLEFPNENCLLNMSEIQYLDISDNRLNVEDIKKFFWWTTPHKLLSLNVSRNSEVKKDLLAALLGGFQDDMCGVQLKSLNLSRCNVQENELYEFLRLCSRSLLDINLSYNPNLTGVSLRRLLEFPSLQNINLIGCNNILRYFDDCDGCDLLQESDATKEKLLKISPSLLDFPGQVSTLVNMFKNKYPECYIEQSDDFLLLSSKRLIYR